jgi:GTP-binding protein HflX
MSDSRRQRARQRALCIAAGPPAEQALGELAELLLTAGVATVGALTQQRAHADPNTYLGPGKVAEAADAARACDANVVACDDELSARQERNLEAALGLPVVDRTAVILDIFAAHASTAEGKLQVELAQLEYNLARMRGLWTHLERLGGGIGTRGPGETQIETDRRLARDRIATLRKRLQRVKSSRATMRAERERAGMPRIALAGYTNAGKSTLLNAMLAAWPAAGRMDGAVSVADRLFHTLDPTTRVVRPGGHPYLLTDTVGFIRKLPHQLVDAFAATLEETTRAELVLHVLDAAADEPQRESMRRAVSHTLHEIGAGEIPRLLVLSKADLLDAPGREELRFAHPDAVLVGALSGEGLDALALRIEHALRRTLRAVDLLVPYTDAPSLAELHRVAGELQREETAEGVRVHALLPERLDGRFARFAVAS